MRAPVEKVTIYTVAEQAGVSISTVSLAINSPHRVSDATRQRVVAAAAQLGYRAGGTASGRATSGVRVAVAAPFTSYPSYFTRLAGMMSVPRSSGVDLSLHDLDSAASVTSPLLDALPARRDVDGLIVMGVPLGSAALRSSRDARLPVVLVDVRRAKAAGGDLPVVLVDDEGGGRLVGEHLQRRGHRAVVFLHEPQRSRDYVSAGMLRAEGISRFVEYVDVAVEPGADPTEALLRALARHPHVTAVFANHDALAALAWRGLVAAGIRVPHDIAIVGYDDGQLASGLGLTTVRQPFEESGRAALDLLLTAISGVDAKVARIDLAPTLVVRESA